MYINPTNPHSSSYGSSGLPHGLTQDAVDEIRDIQSQLKSILKTVNNHPTSDELQNAQIQAQQMQSSIQTLNQQFPKAFISAEHDSISDLGYVQRDINNLIAKPTDPSYLQITNADIKAVITRYDNFLNGGGY